MIRYKIGEEIGFSQDFEIESTLSKNKVTVKAGDKGYIDSKGNVHYTSGQARGLIQRISKEIEMEDYDHHNIAKMLWNRLKSQFEIEEFLGDYDVSEKDVIEELEDVLSDIL